MIARFLEARLIGEVEWVEEAPRDRRRKAKGAATFDQLLDREPDDLRSRRFSVGGTLPHPWTLSILMATWNEEDQQARGYNVLSLCFESALIKELEPDHLSSVFRKVNESRSTEVGLIHPYERWSDLTDTLHGEYGEPVTFGPIFPGVAWMNFLGHEHLQLFGTELRRLQTHDVQWSDDGGLYFQVCENIEDACTPEIEEEMFRLTQQLRSARI